MSRLLDICSVALCVCLAGPAASPIAQTFGSGTATLTRAGQAIEVRGLINRVIAFYEPRAEHVDLTVLLGGGALGTEVLRTRLTLRDGQSHAVILGGDGIGGNAERFSFTRRGEAVEVAFAPVAVSNAHRADAGDADPAEDQLAEIAPELTDVPPARP